MPDHPDPWEVLDAVRLTFERTFRHGEQARREAEAALQTALNEQEKAVAQLRAYTAVPPEVFHRAKVLTVEAAKNSGVSGEAKRHQVYAKLRKEFPNEPHRDLGLAIELALR